MTKVRACASLCISLIVVFLLMSGLTSARDLTSTPTPRPSPPGPTPTSPVITITYAYTVCLPFVSLDAGGTVIPTPRLTPEMGE